MALSAAEIKTLEKRIGYKFSQYERLEESLTHISRQAMHECPHGNYERLEFLGDLVLGLCVGELLFETFPNEQEGELTIRIHSLVNGETCGKIAKQLGLIDFIKKGDEFAAFGGNRVERILSDVFESLIAAIYLDGGLEAAKSFVGKVYKDIIHNKNTILPNSKTALQEWGHKQGYGDPIYKVCQQEGPKHAPHFVIEVCFGKKHKATGESRSKRSAEANAAENLLIKLGVWESKEKKLDSSL